MPLLAAVAGLVACADTLEECYPMSDVQLAIGDTELVQPCFTGGSSDFLTLSASSSDAEVATAAVLVQALRVEGVSSGSATIRVVATDPDGLSGASEFVVTVVGGNQPDRVGRAFCH
ncbi:MAG: hypothetical protein OXQ94_08300 [Gemmatimonadota bacterium]|nr:hypothetical protein [Gemmatimonadota bacterium]MDE2871670.1 hypothetical protein [Gemmatimonadota bacterium]